MSDGGCNQTLCKGVPVRAGCDGLEALREVTRLNPWFAVVSGVLHGGQVEYSRAQAVAEFFAAQDPHDLLDPREVERLLAPMLPPPKPPAPKSRAEQLRLFGLGAVGQALDPQYGVGTVSRRVAAAARGYLRALPEKRRRLNKTDVDRVVYSVCAQCRIDALSKAQQRRVEFDLGPAEKTGIGRKAGALAREYLGDDRAVAVDRHVAGYVYAVTGKLGVVEHLARISKEERERLARRPEVLVVPPQKKNEVVRLFYRDARGDLRPLDVRPWRRGDKIEKEEFEFGTRIIRQLAHECGVTAAAFQVAVWLQSACAARGRGVGFSMPLVGNWVFRCGPVLGQHELPGLGRAAAEVDARLRAAVGRARLYRVGGRIMTG